MKKVLYILFVLIAGVISACSSDEGGSTTRAGIIAEDFVKADVMWPDDLEWNLVGADETATNEYHVVANIKTLNDYGMSIPNKVSVRLKYDGGDWTEKSSWTLVSIKYQR